MIEFEQEWENFKERVIPITASERQIIDMKLAFYGGAVSLAYTIRPEKTNKDIDETTDHIYSTVEELIEKLENV